MSREKLMALAELLDKQSKEIAKAGHNGWGNTMADAARSLRTLAASAESAEGWMPAETFDADGIETCGQCGESVVNHITRCFQRGASRLDKEIRAVLPEYSRLLSDNNTDKESAEVVAYQQRFQIHGLWTDWRDCDEYEWNRFLASPDAGIAPAWQVRRLIVHQDDRAATQEGSPG